MRRRSLALAALVLCASIPALGSTYIWTGARSSRMSDAGNWIGGSPVADAAAELSFPPGAARIDVVNDLPALSVDSISLSGIGYSITGNPITVLNGEITSSMAGPNRIANDVVLAGDATFVVAADSSFSLASELTLSGQLRGPGGVVKLGDGRLVFAGDAPNIYGGDTRVRHGMLLLAKPPRTSGVPGNVFVQTTGANYDRAVLWTVADEQVPDSATITVSYNGEVSFGALETVGPLVLESGAEVGTVMFFGWGSTVGTMILGGDVTVKAHPTIDGQADLSGDIVLPSARVITVTGGRSSYYGLDLDGVRGVSPSAGLTIRAGLRDAIEISGTYEGPTVLEGGVVAMDNLRTAVTLRDGTVAGLAKSFHIQRGQVSNLTATGDLRLDAAAVVAHRVGANPALAAGGTITLAGATLKLEQGGYERLLGKTHPLIENKGPAPVNGAFAGLAEGAVIDGKLRISYVGGTGNDGVLTQVGKYVSRMSLTAPSSVTAFGAAATISARLESLETNAPLTGTVTFRDGDTVLAVVPVTNNSASASVTLPWGYRPLVVTYSGNDTVGGAEETIRVAVAPPRPTVTSITPDSVAGGERVDFVLRGSDFVEGCTVSLSSHLFTTPTWVSSSELRFTWMVPFSSEDQTFQIGVTQPQPGIVESNRVPLKVSGNAAPTSELAFDATGVEGRVTPGASATFFLTLQRPPNIVEHGTITMRDSDNDGLVRLPYNNPLATRGTVLMVDMTAGTIRAGSPNGRRPAALALPPKPFLRDPAGNFSHVVVASSVEWASFVLVRPGVGAWLAETFWEGGPRDLDGALNDVNVFNVASMKPVGSSPAPPPGVAPGDVFLGLETFGDYWFGSQIESQLAETSGAGVLSMTRAVTTVSEKAGSVKVTLLRTEGTDGPVSVNFATSDGTARAGLHYLAAAGTVTFDAGEILEHFDIGIVNNAVYSGETNFKVTLSDPAGAKIKGAGLQTVTIQEADPAPKIVFASTEVQEGDEPGRQVTLDVTLTQAMPVPISMPYTWSEDPYANFDPRGTLVFEPGETRKSVIVTYHGDRLPGPNRTIRVWGGHAFAVAGSVKVVDDDTADVTLLDASVREGGASAWVRIRTSSAIRRETALRYRTVDGTAMAGSDYTATTGSVTLPTHDSIASISIPIVNDAAAEGDEWFRVEITEVDGVGVALRRSYAIVTIGDDESAVLPLLVGADALGGEIDYFGLTFHLSAPSVNEVTFRAKSADGTAVAGRDYMAVDSVIRIPAGQMAGFVRIPVISDNSVEGPETLTITISEVTEAQAVGTTFTATIMDNDSAPPVLRVADIEVAEGHSGQRQATFVVELSEPTPGGLVYRVRYSTRNETAMAPGDYAAASGEVTFTGGENRKTVSVAINGDTASEFDESFQLVLESNDVIFARTAVRCTIVNDDAPPPPTRRRAIRH